MNGLFMRFSNPFSRFSNSIIICLQGFAKAIFGSSMVVVVLSRGAFMGRHDVKSLKPESKCDNVILEWELALGLNDLKGTVVLPLFVGDKV